MKRRSPSKLAGSVIRRDEDASYGFERPRYELSTNLGHGDQQAI